MLSTGPPTVLALLVGGLCRFLDPIFRTNEIEWSMPRGPEFQQMLLLAFDLCAVAYQSFKSYEAWLRNGSEVTFDNCSDRCFKFKVL